MSFLTPPSTSILLDTEMSTGDISVSTIIHIYDSLTTYQYFLNQTDMEILIYTKFTGASFGGADKKLDTRGALKGATLIPLITSASPPMWS